MTKKKILIMFLPILLLITAILGYLKLTNVESDSIKFKNEYESLNGKKKYIEMNVEKNNKVKYSNYDEIFDILNNKTGIIYLGYAECNDCRYAINTLFDVIKDNKIDDTIYYLDNHLDRDSYVLSDTELVYERDKNGKEIKGTDNYFKLLEILDDHLSQYIIYFEEVEYDVGEKRLHFPSVIFVKDGEVLGIEYASLDIPYDDLYSNYEDYLINMYSEVCDINNGVNTPC